MKSLTKTSRFNLLLLLLSTSINLVNAVVYLPLVCMHGMNEYASHTEKNVEAVRKMYNITNGKIVHHGVKEVYRMIDVPIELYESYIKNSDSAPGPEAKNSMKAYRNPFSDSLSNPISKIKTIKKKVLVYSSNATTYYSSNNDGTANSMYFLQLKVYEGFSSMITPISDQLDAVFNAIRSDKNLKKGFIFYGESQGALLARSYVTMRNIWKGSSNIDNDLNDNQAHRMDPPVYNLGALSGPQSGVGECPKIELPYIKTICGDLGTDLDIYHWPYCSFCGYWRGKEKKLYLDNSEYLAGLNNEKVEHYDERKRKNMINLNKYIASVALQDTTVQPAYSAWHTYWYWDDDARSKIMPYNETEGYQQDHLGLKTLDQRGDLILNSYDNVHLGYSMEWWNEHICPHLGVEAETAYEYFRTHDEEYSSNDIMSLKLNDNVNLNQIYI